MEDRKKITLGGISILVLIPLAIVACAALGAFVWWLGVASSGTAGSGNITKDQNSSQNRERWSAQYANDWNTLKADQANIAVAKKAASGKFATAQDATNLEGAQQVCDSDVQTYNTDTANVLGTPFLPAGYPASVSATDYCDGTVQ